MRTRSSLSLALLTYALTACSGGADTGGATLPPVSASASAAGSPSASASSGPPASIPPEAMAATTQGAEAFGRFWVRVVSMAYRNLDATAISALSVPDCSACQRYVNSIKNFQSKNAKVNGDYDATPLEAVAPALEPGAASVNVTVIVNYKQFTVTDPAGNVLLREPAKERAAQNLVLVRRDGTWQVSDVSSS